MEDKVTEHVRPWPALLIFLVGNVKEIGAVDRLQGALL